MRYFCLATDYDGTLAHDGVVDATTLSALEKLKTSGRKLILVTGRELDQLQSIFDRLDLFDLVVAENGGLLYNPASKEATPLCETPPAAFVSRLRELQVPISVGQVIVATWDPFRSKVLETIRELGLELQVIFNKGAVMVLPSGVNKATGLIEALAKLGISRHSVVGVGDAENDHAFLKICECSVAVANALPMLKERADLVTAADHGAGVAELIAGLLESDLAEISPKLKRNDILMGVTKEGKEVRLHPYGGNVLIAGTSGGGKSTLTTAILERLCECGYQFCLIDPEGDYHKLEDALVVGDPKREPTANEILAALDNLKQSVIVNLLGVPLDQRPQFFETLLPRIQALRGKNGHPHWLVVDEAHHVWPLTWENPASLTPKDLVSTMLITLDPLHLSPAVVSSVDMVIAVGEDPKHTIEAFCEAANAAPPALKAVELPRGEVLVWSRSTAGQPVQFKVSPGKTDRVRHGRKYSEGHLDEGRSFYFKGSQGKLNLRAHNLQTFIQLMDGVDEDTWLFHLRQGDYSRWFRKEIKSADLAAEAETVEQERGLTSIESRNRIRGMIESRFTLPA